MRTRVIQDDPATPPDEERIPIPAPPAGTTASANAARGSAKAQPGAWGLPATVRRVLILGPPLALAVVGTLGWVVALGAIAFASLFAAALLAVGVGRRGVDSRA